ncbi:hypothetical protein BC830DRAFT_1175871 [Chytriomyces sp. MP71]|nr:hypothetical protein BC830DRAFT_1175871 [Chytriomyces sp. MP71]
MPDGGRGAPIGDELSLVDDNSYDAPTNVTCDGDREPVLHPPSAESIADKWDHSNSIEDTLRHLELQMIKAQHASKAKEACFLRTLSNKDDQIASVIAQVSELSSQLTAAMQQLFQDAPGEHHGCEDAGRDRQPAGPPPVPTPVAGQTSAHGLQPQQSPPAAVHQQQKQLQPAPAKNKPWGKQPRMSYVVATAANKAAIANQIIGICNGDYLYGKVVLQTIWEVSFVGKGRTLAEVFIAEKDWVQVLEVCHQRKLLCEEEMMRPP